MRAFRLLLLTTALSLAFTFSPAQAADEENPIVTLVKSKVKDKNKPFAMIIHFTVMPGKEKAFAEAFPKCLEATRKEPGCVAYHLNHDVEDPRAFVMYEKFKNITALEEHAKTKHVEELLKTISPMLASAPTVKVYESSE